MMAEHNHAMPHVETMHGETLDLSIQMERLAPAVPR
jgi:hypothetical protein